MSFLNSYIFGDNKKVMPSISSTDVGKLSPIKTEITKPEITKIEIIKIDIPKIKTFYDLIDENENKSLILYDLTGSWTISDKGQQLTRKHNNINFPELQSYYFMSNSREQCTYFLTNGDQFKFSYDSVKEVFLICSIQLSVTHEHIKFEWVVNPLTY